MLNKLIAKAVAYLPENMVWIFSKRYIAGKQLSDAVSEAKKLNLKGIRTTIDALGENIKEVHEAIEYKQNYLDTIRIIKQEQIETSLSVKPSMFGLLLDNEFCYSQLREVVMEANNLGLSVCMDMEDSSSTQIELLMFKRLYTEFPDTVTIVLQAYLHRTLDDLRWLKSIMLPGKPINVRICKGIYVEPETIAYKHYKEINRNYIACASFMLNNRFYAAFATHDKNLVKAIFIILKQKVYTTNSYEFQMLLGVRPKLRDKIVLLNHPMRIYVPYGTHWYAYSTRRLKENPGIIPHIIKALIFRG